jgi:hypothetical protein
MNAVINTGAAKPPPASAELAAAAEISIAEGPSNRGVSEPVAENYKRDVRSEDTQLAPLFLPNVAAEFRSRWDDVQRGFVDDPKQAARQGDELVAQVMKSLAETFSHERATLESELGQTDKSSTETLRVALRRYRSFFERLLSI